MLSCLRILSASHRVIPWKFLPESLGKFLQTATKVNQLSKTAKKHMAKFKLKDNKTNNSTCKQSKKLFENILILYMYNWPSCRHISPWTLTNAKERVTPTLHVIPPYSRCGQCLVGLICCVFGNQYNDLVLAKGSEPPRNPKAATVLSWCLRSWQHLLQP